MEYRDPERFREMLQTMNDAQIAVHCGVSVMTIRNWRHRFGLARSPIRNPGNTRYPVDRTFFQSIDTPEKAYILGLIVTDGFVAHNQNGRFFGICLKESDAPLLEAVRNAIGSTAPIARRFAKTSIKPCWMAWMTICSIDLVRQLEALGVGLGKTYNVTYPNILPSLASHFIRGLWDGDGNINEWNFQLYGTVGLIDGTHAAIKEGTGHSLSIQPKASGSNLVGYRRDADVLHWIYQDATLTLPRKYDTFQKFWGQAPGAKSLNLPLAPSDV